jgi:cyclophilin family peptidyl-prolyl cis-trans isomerase
MVSWLGLQSVTLHTNLGDIKIEVFCEQVRSSCSNPLEQAACRLTSWSLSPQAPRTAENFLALCASGVRGQPAASRATAAPLCSCSS